MLLETKEQHQKLSIYAAAIAGTGSTELTVLVNLIIRRLFEVPICVN
jgi:hypothetical protein